MAFGTKKKKRQVDLKERVWNWDFKGGLLAAGVCIFAVLFVIGLNLVVQNLPSSITKFDTTEAGLHTISDETIAMLQEDIQEDVQIYLVASHGEEDDLVVDVLSRYEEHCDFIEVTQVDPADRPDFLGQYTNDDAVAENTLIIETDRRFRLIANGEYNTTTRFMAEDYVNSALQYVTAETLPTVYCLTGHGEVVLPDTVASTIRLDGYVVEDLDLSNRSEMPEDIGMLLIYAPSSDLSKEEANLILSYLDNGGRLLLLSAYDMPELPNLANIMENYGVAKVDGMVYEGATGTTIDSAPTYIVPQMQTVSKTESLINGVDNVLITHSHGIREVPEHRSSVLVYPLFVSSDSSYSKLDPESDVQEKEFEDIAGPHSLAVAIVEEFDDVETRIVWVGTNEMLNELMDEFVLGGNSFAFLNAVSWLCSVEDVTALHVKTLTAHKLYMPTSTSSFYSVLMVGVIPLCFLAVGIVVWVRRKVR